MSRRILCLLALLFVADAIAVNGRAPRPVVLSGKEMLDVTRFTRLQVSPAA
ncbi:hypothetical protein HPT29_010060 [Microvirga terrae]|uniref:Uncharacterized protein n=1 Tax=Microvirga terrae TaxID=2740529 RepID=A0ABY5RW10_9HYPH|nr:MULTISPECIES: hypothetical protein [Microvirga]MBQ0821772.1 hypothetical protein [Microvirga sp. HBU67558]UVF21430.1 hypothetical protein HPT29_010060 [Microvirga terrae]